MGRLLGLGISDFPFLRFEGPFTGVLKNALASPRMKPQMKDPASWPEEMRREWGNDEGLSASEPVRRRQVESLRLIRAALDEFKPDFVIMLAKDHLETLQKYALPPYWIGAWDSFEMKPFGMRPKNVFGDDSERVVRVEGHPEGAFTLIRALQDAEMYPTYALLSMHPNGITHTFCGAITHLDWDGRTFSDRIVPIPIDPFGPRERAPEGLGPLTPEMPMPMPSHRAFKLGQVIARAVRNSNYNVAMVAAAGWSHTQNTSWERGWVHPDMDGDASRYEEWRDNRFHLWQNFSYQDMEDHGQWEHICWITLAGAMSELGAKVLYSDFQANWCFNQNMVNSIFSVV
jgi:hypothetical protein